MNFDLKKNQFFLHLFSESINRTMNKLIQRVSDLSELDKTFSEQKLKMNIMGKCIEYLQEISSTNHSLFSLFDR